MKKLITFFFILVIFSFGIFASNNIRIDNLGTTNYLFPQTDGNANQIITTNGAGLLYWTDIPDINSTGTSYWTQSGTDLYYNDGDVGIGTTNPTQKLHVNGNLNISTGQIYVDTTKILNYDLGYISIGANAGSNNIGDLSIGNGAGSSSTTTYSTSIGDLAGSINTGNGIIAIGQGANRRNTGDYSIAIGFESFTRNTGDFSIGIGRSAGYTNKGNNLIAIGNQAGQNNNIDNQFILKQNNINTTPLIQGDFLTGYLGIGTTTPKNKLDVEGGAVIGATYSGTNTAPTNGLLVEGDVGIGTTTPSEKLDIDGNIHISELEGTYTGGSAYVCVYDSGVLYASDEPCP